MSKSPSTLLRYPGGKRRAIKFLLPLLPLTVAIVSPFFGGGSVEIALAQRGQQVYGYDAFAPLVDFWQAVQSNPAQVKADVAALYPMTKPTFQALQAKQCITPADFYALNRSSYSGTTLSGGMSPSCQRFTQSAVERVGNWQPLPNLTVDCLDFKSSLQKHPNDFAFCDPPYLVSSKLYGRKGSLHTGFDHAGLASILTARKNWLLTINNHPDIINLYQGCQLTQVNYVYGMSKTKSTTELIITP